MQKGRYKPILFPDLPKNNDRFANFYRLAKKLPTASKGLGDEVMWNWLLRHANDHVLMFQYYFDHFNLPPPPPHHE